MLRLEFLGEQRVSFEGAAPAPSLVSGRALEILAFLVLHAGLPQERVRLAGLIWPDSSEGQSRTNLRRELHGLRQLPGLAHLIQADGAALLWREGDGSHSDVYDFMRHRELALRLARERDPAGVRLHAAAAIGAYKGQLLPGMYSDWVQAERELLHRQCVELCDLVARAPDTDLQGALGAARRRLQLEPLEEAGYQTLMELQCQAGDAAAALGTYHRCASVLEQELHVKPGLRTKELARRLLGHLPVGRPDGGRAVMALAPGPRARPPVGRAREETLLLKRWGSAAAGAPGLMVVRGEAGVGKTRLLVSLLAAAKSEGAATAYARCFRGVGRMALAPVAEWLRSADFDAVAATADGSWTTELARLLPRDAAGNPPLREPDLVNGPDNALTDAWRRRAFYEGVAQAVLAAGRPTLLVLDDLQWCDEESLDWLAFLFAHAPAARLLVAAGVRTGELLRAPAARAGLEVLRDGGWAEQLELPPLDAASSAELAASVLDRRLTVAEESLLQGATGGYPLYVVEAARGMAGSSLADVLAGATAGQGLLGRRLAQCSPQARTVATLAAAVGREFPLELIARASGIEELALVRAVDELWRLRILREQRGGYDFSHDLLRQCAYELASPPQRWQLHRRLAEAMEGLHPGNSTAVAAQLAEQYRRSGNVDRAVHFYLQAGDAATSIFANARAISDYQDALDLLTSREPGAGTAGQELDVLLRMPAPLTALRGYSSPQLRVTLERIIELCGGLDRPRDLARALIGLFASTFVQGHTKLAHSLALRALELAGDMPGLSGQAHFAAAGAATSLGRLEEAVEHFRLAWALGPDTQSYILGTRIDVHSRAWGAHALWLSGNGEGAMALSRASVDRAERSGHPYSLAVALAYHAVLLAMGMPPGEYAASDAGELARTTAALEETCTRYNFAYYGQWGAILRGWLSGGEPGLEAVRGGIGKLRATLAFSRMPFWLCLLADTLQSCGQPLGADAVLAAAQSTAVAHGDLWWLPEVLRRRALLAEPAAAARLLDTARHLAQDQHSVMLARRLPPR